ncbi:response regulator [Rhizobium multihospitium]|uniref:Two component transcriptional regulator, LuxR family n=1 Tax=Rhizobium multihospitium TaxID=410764 RepID=A0A1C3VW44_9HYPH|nr:response regulator transcription factor [Rhizobium multihospitium]SCB32012.1 two component transcriptional regulator, LuxR family [Rhizobium multihospitium]
MTAHMSKIIIADDHPIVRAGIRAALAHRPDWCICAEADDGEAAVQLSLEHGADIIILDHCLPIINGLEVSRQLCRKMPKISVLVYTMYEDHALVRDIMNAGARGYVLKTEEDASLLAAVEALISGKIYMSRQVQQSIADAEESAGGLDDRDSLTPREREVVQFVAEGKSNKTIAGLLGVSIKTVDSHRTSSMRKLKLHTAVDLARYAIRNKLIKL